MSNMIDPNTLPYVDLSNSPDSLRAYAIEHFGKKIHPSAGDATVRERFGQIYKEETGRELPPYDPAADQGSNDFDDDAEQSAATEKKREPKFAVVLLAEDEHDPHDVKLGHNFTAYLIQRNVETKVPYFMVNVLRDAKRMVFNPRTMEAKEVPAYPFSIVELIYDEA